MSLPSGILGRQDRSPGRAVGALVLGCLYVFLASGCAPFAARPRAAGESAGRQAARASSPAPPSASLFERPWVWSDERGTSVRLSDWRGSLLVVSLIYTSCTTTCPLTIEKLRRLDETFQREARPTEFVLVTLDPSNDTADQLRRFKSQRGLPARWHLLRGDDQQTQELSDLLRVKIINPGGHIFHEVRIVLFDAQGKILGQVRDGA